MRWLTRLGYGAVTVRLAVLLALPAVGVCVVSTPEVALGSVENPVPVTVSVTGDVVTVGTGENAGDGKRSRYPAEIEVSRAEHLSRQRVGERVGRSRRIPGPPHETQVAGPGARCAIHRAGIAMRCRPTAGPRRGFASVSTGRAESVEVFEKGEKKLAGTTGLEPA